MSELQNALKELRDAQAFHDRVAASSLDEQLAVGQDHHDRLDRAVQRVVALGVPAESGAHWAEHAAAWHDSEAMRYREQLRGASGEVTSLVWFISMHQESATTLRALAAPQETGDV